MSMSRSKVSSWWGMPFKPPTNGDEDSFSATGYAAINKRRSNVTKTSCGRLLNESPSPPDYSTRASSRSPAPLSAINTSTEIDRGSPLLNGFHERLSAPTHSRTKSPELRAIKAPVLTIPDVSSLSVAMEEDCSLLCPPHPTSTVDQQFGTDKLSVLNYPKGQLSMINLTSDSLFSIGDASRNVLSRSLVSDYLAQRVPDRPSSAKTVTKLSKYLPPKATGAASPTRCLPRPVYPHCHKNDSRCSHKPPANANGETAARCRSGVLPTRRVSTARSEEWAPSDQIESQPALQVLSRSSISLSHSSSLPSQLDYDIKFGDVKVKLLKKLSAKCHCQFDVWEAQSLHDSRIFALKLLNLEEVDSGRLKYKQHSITEEGGQLERICKQLDELREEAKHIQRSSMFADNLTEPSTSAALLVRSRPRPIPQYYWTSNGRMARTDERVLGVAMEVIRGRTLTQVLQQMRAPRKPSLGLLVLEMALKIVEAQRLLSESLPSPIINWDTKPGNIVLDLCRSQKSGRLRCKRAVIIDLGDALPGPTFDFPTKHRAGQSPAYIICTKGYCSPECAILVFLLASTPRCGAFRSVWYGQNVDLQKMQRCRSIRLEHHWQEWFKNGFIANSLRSGGLPLVQGYTPVTHNIGATLSNLHFMNSANRDESAKSKEANRKNGQPLDKAAVCGSCDSWEVKFSQASVVFSTGLVLAQLFGGQNILQLVSKDETRALDALCEWSAKASLNSYTNSPNVGPEDLLPSTGMFATGHLREKVLVLLQGCLAFVPSHRWTFAQVEVYLKQMLHEYHRAYAESKRHAE